MRNTNPLYEINPPRLTKQGKTEYIEEAIEAFEEDFRYAEDVIKAARVRKERKNKRAL